MSLDLILLIGQIMLKYGPQVGKAFQVLFTKKDPTQADWDKVWALAEQPWQDYNLQTPSQNNTPISEPNLG